jgi:hypothetical protein
METAPTIFYEYKLGYLCEKRYNELNAVSVNLQKLLHVAPLGSGVDFIRRKFIIYG